MLVYLSAELVEGLLVGAHARVGALVLAVERVKLSPVSTQLLGRCDMHVLSAQLRQKIIK